MSSALFRVLDISSAGMDVQQARLQAAASNVANARTTEHNGVGYQPLSVVVHSAPLDGGGATSSGAAPTLSRPVVAGVVAQPTAPRLVYDPGHPDADARGFVSLPGVDPIASMLDLISISRSYEANLHAFDITRTLMQRTLDIGGRR